MTKRILCAILCLAMVATTLMIPISAALDLTASTYSWSEQSSLKVSTSQSADHNTSISLGGTITETSTVSFWVMNSTATGSVQSGFKIRLMNSIPGNAGQINDGTVLGGIYPWISDGTNLKWTTDSSNSIWNGSGLPAAYTPQGKWTRIDFIVDFEKKTFTAYVGGVNAGTTTIPASITSYGYLNFGYVGKNGEKYFYVDNLLVTKGANVPTATDLASNVTPGKLAAAKANVLFFDPYDNANIGNSYVNNDVYNAAQNHNYGAYVFKNEIVKTQGIAPVYEEISDTSSLFMQGVPTSTASAYYINFGEISQNATFTFYFMPSATCFDAKGGAYQFWLQSGDTTVGGFASDYDTAPYGSKLWMRTKDGPCWGSNPWGAAYEQPLVLEKWNRLDLLLDFDKDTITGYLNYALVGSAEIDSGITSVDHLKIPTIGFNVGTSTAYIDNFIVTKGLNAPKWNDAAVGVTGAKLDANATDILYYDTFDSTTIQVANTTHTKGTAAVHGAQYGWLLLNNTIGITPDTAPVVSPITDNSSMFFLTPKNGSELIYIHLGEIKENATLTFYFRPAASYIGANDATTFSLRSGETEIGGFLSCGNAGCNGTAFMKASGRGHTWDGYNGANAQPLVADEWNRYDLVIDIKNQKMTGYVNYKLLETVDFIAAADSFDTLVLPNLRGGSGADNVCYMDNLIVTKGTNAPAKDDLAAGLTAEKLLINADNVLQHFTFDSTTNFIRGGTDAKIPGSVYSAQGSYGWYALNTSIGMTSETKAVIPPVKDNSSLKLLAPNNGGDGHGEYRFYFGNVAQNSTLTWYVKTSPEFANHENSFYYKLYSGDTFLGGFESNAYGNETYGKGQSVHMNTTQAGQDQNAKVEEGAPVNFWNIAKTIDLEGWNRLDLVVDFENKTITGYLNYSIVQTLSFDQSGLTSFDHLKIGGYSGSFNGAKYIFVDNMALTKGANAPVRGDFATNISVETIEANEENILFCECFNITAPVVHGKDFGAFEAGKIYNYRKDKNPGFCGVNTTIGICAPTGEKPVYQGVQSTKIDDKDNWTFNVRFVATLNTIATFEHNSKTKSILGFDVVLNGKSATIICQNYYDKLTGSDATGITIEYTAKEDFNANYIYALTLTGLSTKAIYDLAVTPFAYDSNGVKTYGDTARVIYENGLLTENSFEIYAKPENDKGTAVNIDSDALYNVYKNYILSGTYTIDNLEYILKDWFAYHYKDCGVSDILYNPEWTIPSDKYEDAIDKLNAGKYNASSEDKLLASKVMYESGIDPYQVWFDECRKNGINPWLSFRMNDVHYADDYEDGRMDAFFYTAKQNGWLIGNSRQEYWNSNDCTIGSRYWYQYAYDYSVAQVREYFLNKIDAQLAMYDVYGIELDWQRQMWCFENDSMDNIQYMNIMLEEVNKIVAKYENEYGHEIKIAIRLNRSLYEAKFFGFDVVNFAQNDWIDVVIPSSYWGSTDSDMPIYEWVMMLEQYGVDVWAGLECHIMNNNYWHTVSSLAGYTAQYLGQGASQMYLYNMFGYKMKTPFRVCASIEMAQAAERRSYILTESNCTPYNVGIEKWDILPIKLNANASTNMLININHGELIETNQVIIYVAANVQPSAVMYNYVNCELIGTTTNSMAHISNSTAAADLGTMYAYRVPASAVANSTAGTITINAGASATTITYVELAN